MLVIVSGLLGAVGAGGDIVDGLRHLFGPDFVVTYEIMCGILGILMIFSGVGIIAGGLLMTTRRLETGRVVVLVSVSAGILGLLLSLFQAAVTGNLSMGWNVQVVQSIGWVGAILSVIARIIAEQKPLSAP